MQSASETSRTSTTSTSKPTDEKTSSTTPASKQIPPGEYLKQFCQKNHNSSTINREIPGYGSSLRLAVALRDYESVVTLLQKNISLTDSQEGQKGSIIWSALSSGDRRITQALLDENYARIKNRNPDQADSIYRDYLANMLLVTLQHYHHDKAPPSAQDKSRLSRMISILIRNNADVEAAITAHLRRLPQPATPSRPLTEQESRELFREEHHKWRATVHRHVRSKVADHKKYGESRFPGGKKIFWTEEFKAAQKASEFKTTPEEPPSQVAFKGQDKFYKTLEDYVQFMILYGEAKAHNTQKQGLTELIKPLEREGASVQACMNWFLKELWAAQGEERAEIEKLMNRFAVAANQYRLDSTESFSLDHSEIDKQTPIAPTDVKLGSPKKMLEQQLGNFDVLSGTPEELSQLFESAKSTLDQGTIDKYLYIHFLTAVTSYDEVDTPKEKEDLQSYIQMLMGHGATVTSARSLLANMIQEKVFEPEFMDYFNANIQAYSRDLQKLPREQAMHSRFFSSSYSSSTPSSSSSLSSAVEPEQSSSISSSSSSVSSSSSPPK